jgi:hypothetical protein
MVSAVVFSAINDLDDGRSENVQQVKLMEFFGPVAQLDRATDS